MSKHRANPGADFTGMVPVPESPADPTGADLEHKGPQDTGGFPGPDRDPNAKPAAEKKARRGPDPELQTMAKIDGLMAELHSDAQYRVLEWLKGRYQSRHTVYRPETQGTDTP